MLSDTPSVTQLSQVIGQVTAPAFILGAVAAFTSVLISRMNRIIDRSQALNAIGDDDASKAHLKADIPRLKRREVIVGAAARRYCVSTSEQTIEHQRTQTEKFRLDQIVWDEGVSGVSTKLAEHPRGRRLFDLLREGDTLVVCWVVDWAGTTRTSATPFASLCDAASSSAR
jgi:hypothetical protein